MSEKTEFKVEISGFKTREQAVQFCRWYEGQGEQDIIVWLESRPNLGCEYMNTVLNPAPSWEGNTFKMAVKPE